MASKNGSGKKSGNDNKPRVSAQQKKMRAQQVGMGVFAIILIVAMIISLFIR